MKRFVIWLSVLALLLCTAAYASELEITYWDVNFRSAPGGNVLGRFDGGEILEALDEVWSDNQLWYRARSDQYGEGYVSAVYAVPVWEDQRVFTPAGQPEKDHFTDNMRSFRLEWLTYLYENDYIVWDGDDVPAYNSPQHSADGYTPSTPQLVLRLAELLQNHGMLVQTAQTEILTDLTAPPEQRLQAASGILKAHYGSDDFWEILYNRGDAGFYPSSDWHTPEFPTNADYRSENEIFALVSDQYRQADTPAKDPDISGDTVLYYNPDGGTRYHADRNCPSANHKYLPFSGQFTWSEVNDEPYAALQPCGVCEAPVRR